MKRIIAAIALIVTLLCAFGLSTTVLADEKQKVVYHLSEAEKVNFVLSNIKNHIEGMGGPENVEIILVAHGPGLKAFHEIEASDQLKSMITNLQSEGVQFNACGNTMRAQGVELSDLLPGFVRVDQGGVVRIAQLQQQGYIYIRP